MGLPGANSAAAKQHLARFGPFEFDLDSLKLSRNGRNTGLQRQPALLLLHLVRRSGAIVTRAELRDAVWPFGTYVEFDFGLNTTVNRLRRVLRDSASAPRYIETVPKQGYRFIAPVELVMPSLEVATDLGPQLVTSTPEAKPHIEAEEQLQTSSKDALVLPKSRRLRRRAAVITAVSMACVVIALGLLIAHLRPAATNARATVLRSYLLLPSGYVPEVVTISPSGSEIILQAKANGLRRLYRRSLEDEEMRSIPDSENATQPFFSPDGKEVGFYTPGTLRVTVSNGYRDLVAVAPEFDLRRAIWGEDEFIYYTTPHEGIWRVPAGGGHPQPVIQQLSAQTGSPFSFPQQLLAGVAPALLISVNNGPKRRWITTVAPDGKRPPQVVVEKAMGGTLLNTGHLLYYWDGKLYAASFNRQTQRLTGSPIEVLSQVAANGWRGPAASVSENGTLVYLETQEIRNKLVWVDRKGRETALPIPVAAYEQAEVSPDGESIAIVRRDAPGLWTVWAYKIRTGAWTRLLDQDTPRPRCTWSPDGKSIVASAAFGDTQFVNLYRIPVASPEESERLTEDPSHGQFPTAWSAAANAILYTEGVHLGTQSDIGALSLAHPQRPRLMVSTSGIEKSAAFSPDGRWFAYASDASGRSEVFVQRFDQLTPPLQISRDGGTDPVWSHDGKWVYFLDLHRALLGVSWSRDIPAGLPRPILPPGFGEAADWWTRLYSVAPDGRFLVVRSVTTEAARTPRIRMIVNWTEELRHLSPVPNAY